MTRRERTLFLVAIGPLLGLVQVAGMIVEELTRGVAVPWSEHAWTFVGVALWSLFIPTLVRTSARRLLRRERLAGQLLRHLLTGAAISLTTAIVYLDLHMLNELAGGMHYQPRRLLHALLSGALLEDLVIYGSIVGISNAVASYDRLRAGEIRTSQLETALVSAELQMLRSQLDPHFVFNTLNSIAALTRRDPEAAERMVGRLGDFLRLTLRGEGRQEVSLGQELEDLQGYLEIQRVRFRDRLAVEIRVSPAALGCLVPHLVLQPLVENSIKHGMDRQGGLQVWVSARQQEDRLLLEVEDDGPGPRVDSGAGSRDGANGPGPRLDHSGGPQGGANGPGPRLDPDGGRGEGLGLSTTRRRLEKLYGGGQRLEVRQRQHDGGGAIVSIVLPLRRASVLDPPATG